MKSEEITFTKEEVTNLLRTLSRFEGWTWSVNKEKIAKDEINEVLYAWTEILSEKLNKDTK